MNDMVKMIFGLMGGLAMFLYGMNAMSSSLQKAAGDRMKRMLEFLTGNPFMGALAGALVTAVLQSSSATTVMAIGFVSAGLMSLPQAISVIFGANIGTTMTAQLMAFKISNYIYPILFIGFLMNFACKKEKLKDVGTVIFSFGLLFEGIEIMSGVMKPLAASPLFTDLMGRVAQIPVLGILLGAVMTLIVQSSSATIAVLQSFASQAGPDGVASVMGLAGAIPILLGDNIGTTITALLASIGQSKNAKRTALAHCFFNISGTILFAGMLPVFAQFVQWISPEGPEIEVISRQIANAHTTFNVVCTLIWLPLIPLMVKLVTTVIRGEDETVREAFQPRYLDENVLGQPVAALYLVSREIRRCARCASQMMDAAMEELAGGDAASGIAFDRLYETVKHLQESIVSYISHMFARGMLTETQSEQTVGLLFVANNVERIADHCNEVTGIVRRLKGEGKTLSVNAREELRQSLAAAGELFRKAMDAVSTGDMDTVRRIAGGRRTIHAAQKDLNRAHLNRVQEKLCDASLTGEYASILYGLDRIADNCVGIAEEAMDNLRFTTLEDVGAQLQPARG